MEVCIARYNLDNPEIMECKSLYNANENKWTPLRVGQVLNGTFYVGTKPEFCMSYYAGVSELNEGEFEVLLTLKVPEGVIPLEDSYMGSEAVVTNPLVLEIKGI